MSDTQAPQLSYDEAVELSIQVYNQWKNVPAPQRGELIKTFGEVLSLYKHQLAQQITKDMGKTIRESLGEVQEAIDMCTFAAGLSRQLYGLTMPSERPQHRIQEMWLPIGPIGVITAFNFPIAVWAWNFCLAVICGNTVVWKPSEKAEGCAKLVQTLWDLACSRANMVAYECVSIIVYGGKQVAIQMANDTRIPLISATGSTQMGKDIAPLVAKRMGKYLLELGGNNGVIVSEHGDIDLAVKAVAFGVAGTTGQRCTSTRRVFVHESKMPLFMDKLTRAFETVVIGDPNDPNTLMGPLVSEQARDGMLKGIADATDQGGLHRCGSSFHLIPNDETVYVTPTIIETYKHLPIMDDETFAPIVFVMSYREFDQAIQLVNCVPQGLSASIFTNNVLEAEQFISQIVAGIVNVNTGTSGAEIGGAFGGEKDTGGGRESGSDSWKQYMRRVTTTINYSGTLPLAQGIKFDV